jgi:hypothetical protein
MQQLLLLCELKYICMSNVCLVYICVRHSLP